MRIGAGLVDMLERAAWHASPHEACALLLGSADNSTFTVATAVVTENVTVGDPETSFEIDPAIHIQMQKLARAGGPSVIGVWHSHPKGAAEPSDVDKAQSVEPGWVWLITGHTPDSDSVTRAFVASATNSHELQPASMDVTPH